MQDLNVLVENDKSWAVGALMTLYQKDIFFPSDVKFLTSLAEYYLRTDFLSKEQIYYLRMNLKKYSKRLNILGISPLPVRNTPNFYKMKKNEPVFDPAFKSDKDVVVRIEGKKAYFDSIGKKELEHIRKLLTWESETQEIETILYEDEGNYWTFYGLISLLQQKCPFNITVLNQEEKKETKLFKLKKNPLKNIELYDYQIEAIEACVTQKNGIVHAATGSGKTEIILGTIKTLLKSKKIKTCLVIVPSVGLAQQFIERALLRGFNEKDIGVLYGGSDEQELKKPLVCAVINSIYIGLQSEDKMIERLLSYDGLIFDECQHMQSMMNFEVAFRTTAQYLFGFSGSPFKEKDVLSNSGDALVFGITGQVIYKITPGTLAKRGIIATPIMFFKTVFDGVFRANSDPYSLVYKSFVETNITRNKYIIEYIKMFIDNGHKVLIPVQRKKHALSLLKQLNDPKAICIFGGSEGFDLDGAKEIDYNEFRNDFENGKYHVVIGTQVLDEGFDVPAIGAIIMAGGGKSRIKNLQRIGRGLRKKEGLNEVYIIDFDDKTHVYLASQSKKRKTLYQEDIEATIIEDEDEFLNRVKGEK